MEAHIRLYEGYVQKYNQLSGKLWEIQSREPPRGVLTDGENLKTDMTFALSAVKNHELFFDILTPPPDQDQPSGVLADDLVKTFQSVPRYLMDLKQSALAAKGWAWTAYDLDNDFLVNYGAGALDAMPVWNTVPLLAIDLYGHAYFYDYGNNKQAYVEAVMKAINWGKVAGRLAQAKARRGC